MNSPLPASWSASANRLLSLLLRGLVSAVAMGLWKALLLL